MRGGVVHTAGVRRPVFVGVLGLVLGACRGSSPAAVEPLGPAEVGVDREPVVRSEGSPAFDLEGFEPPFGRVPLSEVFVRERGIRRVVVHEDTNTEDVRLVDMEVTTSDYDRTGHILHSTTLDRGQPSEEVNYSYDDGHLIGELHVSSGGARHEVVYAHGATGRVERVEHVFSSGTIEELLAYDEHGRRSSITRIEGGRRSEQRVVYEQDRLRRIVTSLPDGREIVTERSYGADGRPTRWVTTDSAGGVDTYEFTWTTRGWLRTLSFTEDDAPIYQRTYAYDEDGRPLREVLESFVPAMGQGSVARYEYERHGEPRREAAPLARSERTKAELLAATVAAFPGAYVELARVSFESHEEDRFVPSSVTVLIPEAIVRKLSETDLKTRACTARRALGWDCDCEHVTLGEPVEYAWHSWPDKRVVPLTLHFGLGC
jgi:hypothetical protein